MVKRFEVYLVNLDPTEGHEIKKTRPAVVVSPNEMNRWSTVIIAPMTTKSRDCPTRIPLKFGSKKGYVVIDQIRTVDKSRLVKLLGSVDIKTAKRVLNVLQEMFAD